MGEATAIEWTDHTFNPWWGCTRVPRLPDAPGSACDHCYAATLAQRFGVRWGASSAPRLFEAKHWNNPIRWDRKAKAEGVRRRVFCASMGDVFERRGNEHDATLDEQRARLWPLIEACDGLDWQLLTKRPENVPGMVPPAWLESWPAHVHVGTTIACQADADARIPRLLEIPARVRFVSAEPLLGPVDLTRWLGESHLWDRWVGPCGCDEERDPWTRCDVCEDRGWEPPPCRGLAWVIVGGESGNGARPMHPQWVRDIRDQCDRASTPFLFKQWGEWVEVAPDYGAPGDRWLLPEPLGMVPYVPGDGRWYTAPLMRRAGKHAAGRELDGRTHDGFPAGDG